MNPRPCDLTQWQKVIIHLSDGTTAVFFGPAQVYEVDVISVERLLFTIPDDMPKDLRFEVLPEVKP